jgi:uncharacterized membrane protein
MEQITGVLGVITGLVSVVMSLGIVFWWIYWSYRKKQLQYQERQLMIEKGLTPPPVLPEEKLTPEKVLRRGTVLLCLGVGLGLAAVIGAIQVEQELGGILAVAAAIVGFIGLGNLVYYYIARRSERETREKTNVVL